MLSILIKVLQKENPDWFNDEYHKRIQDMCLNAFEAEKDVVDWIFENGELDFLPKAVVNEFLKNRFNNSLESIGIEKAKQVIEKAKLILFVLDNNQAITEDDKKLLELTKDKTRIIIVNKADLEKELHHQFKDVVEISALHKQGLADLESKITELFVQGTVKQDFSQIISNARHISKLTETKKALQDAIKSINLAMPIDMVEIDLKEAWSLLGDIIGQTSSTSLLDELFSKFCLGK